MSELPDAQQLLSKVKIPPAPELLVKLNELLQSGDPELQQVAEIIEKDVGISALMLKAVNSPMFPLRTEVTSVQHAISLLGISFTVNIATSLILRQTLDSPNNNLPRYWERPSNIALLMARMSRQLSVCSADEAYMLGLFHNCGHAIIHQRYPDYHEFYVEYFDHPQDSITFFENERYGFDHATVGYFLARSWGLAEHLCVVIRDHHQCRQVLQQGNAQLEFDCIKGLLALLKIADHFENEFFNLEQDYEWQRARPYVLDYLSLSEVDFENLRADMLEVLEMEAA